MRTNLTNIISILESQQQAAKTPLYVISLSASLNPKKGINSHIINELIKSNKIKTDNQPVSLSTKDSSTTPLIVKTNNKLLSMYSNDFIDLMNNASYFNADNVFQNFKRAKVENEIVTFIGINSAHTYFNNNKKEIIDAFKKTGKKQNPMTWSIVNLNGADGIEVVETNNLGLTDISSEQEASTDKQKQEAEQNG